MEDYIIQLVEAVCGILAIVLVRFVHNVTVKTKESVKNDKVSAYIDLLEQAVNDAVTATNQTFVDSLKESGSFDEDAQREAFERTKTAVLNVLGESGQLVLEQAVGDLNVLLDAKIEATVKFEKK